VGQRGSFLRVAADRAVCAGEPPRSRRPVRVVRWPAQAATSLLRGRPRGRLRGITTPWRKS
jgi:hypothetical protein